MKAPPCPQMLKVEVAESDKHSSLLQCRSVRSLPVERSHIFDTTNVGSTLPTNVEGGSY